MSRREQILAPVAVVTVLALAIGARGNRSESPQIATGSQIEIGEPIVIDAQFNEVFTPESTTGAEAYLSPEVAWEKWEGGLKLPAAVTAQFGLLDSMTGPKGAPGTEVQYDRLPVWSFSQPGCETPITGIEPSDSTSSGPSDSTMSPTTESGSPGPQCVSWTFVDAATGQEIDSTSQTIE